MTVALWCAFGFALVPAVLIAWNLTIFRPPRSEPASARRVSVLIPARNEAANIRAALQSVLANRAVDLEVLVLDDQSTDATVAIANDVARADPRLRLMTGRPLPDGACGKPWACAQLAEAATGDVLVFMDADVRLAPDALARLTAELDSSRAAMISGVPFQITRSVGERLVVPLIHFVLLGFLPIAAMRATTAPAFGAACGQLIAVSRDKYVGSGGHSRILASLHDGLTLARSFRRNGLRTDLTDVTRIASCRMYGNWREVREGFAKNAHEGLGSRRAIVPWSLLLLGGQVLPLSVLPWLRAPEAIVPAAGAVLLAYAARAMLALRFRQSWVGVAAHPVAVAALVGIQWYALARRALRRPVEWKNRATPASAS